MGVKFTIVAVTDLLAMPRRDAGCVLKAAAVAAGLADAEPISGRGAVDDDAADLAAPNLALADDAAHLPLAVVERLLAGEHVIRAPRDWRGLDQAALAGRMGTTRNHISQIESGARRGVRRSVDFAAALDVPEAVIRARL